MTEEQEKIVKGWIVTQTLCDYFLRGIDSVVCVKYYKHTQCCLEECTGQEVVGVAMNEEATTDSFRAGLDL